jgi:hypothetical protein
MLIVTEAKAQGWRAVAVLPDRGEALLFVGRSSTQVRGGYTEAFHELFEADDRDQVSVIKLQQWQGAPDAGKWQDKAELRVPAPTKTLLKMAA